MLQNVRVNRQLGSINRGGEHELGGNLFLVKESFDCFLVLRVIYDNDAKLVVAEWESVAVFHIPSTIALSTQVSRYFNPIVVTWIVDSDTENAASVLHFFDNFVGAVEIVLTINDTPGRSSKVSRVSMLNFTESIVIPGGFAPLSHDLGRMQNLALDDGLLVAKFDFELSKFRHV